MNFNDDWEEVKLGDVIDIQSGYGFKSKELNDNCLGIPVIKIKNLTPPRIDVSNIQYYNGNNLEELNRYKLKYNDILISMTGSHVTQMASAVGKVSRIQFKNQEFLLNQRVGKFEVKNDDLIDYDFLYYLVSRKEFQYKLASGASGSANQANISTSQIKSIKINLPPIDEQKSIAKILLSLDEKIEINSKMNKTLEEMAQAIYKSWFIDFEPFQDENFVDSERGMIPESWEVGHLGDKNLTSIVRGSIDKFKGQKIYLATADVNDTKIDNYDTIITYDERPSRANRKPEVNTVWFAKMKNSRKLILVADYNTFLINNIILSTGFTGLKVKKNALYYIWNFIYNEDFERKKDKLCTGTTMEAINNKNTKKIKIIIPPVRILKEFNDLVKPFYKKIHSNKIENISLKEIRDNLLPKLMSGEIRVI